MAISHIVLKHKIWQMMNCFILLNNENIRTLIFLILDMVERMKEILEIKGNTMGWLICILCKSIFNLIFDLLFTIILLKFFF